MKDPQDYCPKCGNEYFHKCLYDWCAWPCNKYWSEKQLEKYITAYQAQVDHHAQRLQNALMEFCGI